MLAVSTLSKLCSVTKTKVRYCACSTCHQFRAKLDNEQFEAWVKEHTQVIRSPRPGSHVQKTAFQPFPGVKWPRTPLLQSSRS